MIRTEKMFEVTFIATYYTLMVNTSVPYDTEDAESLAILNARDMIEDMYGFNPESHAYEIVAELLGYN